MKDNKFKKGDYVRYIGTSYPSAKKEDEVDELLDAMEES